MRCRAVRLAAAESTFGGDEGAAHPGVAAGVAAEATDANADAGVRALLVHALHDRAKQFYEHYGFQESPQHPMTLMLRLNTVKA